MKKLTGSKVLGFCGAVFLLVGIGLFGGTLLIQQQNRAKATALVATMLELMPPIQNANLEDRTNSALPSMEIEGEELVGLLELPTFEKLLPVGQQWNLSPVSAYPCRYLGSVLKGPLILGGTDAPGQFDFMKEISLEDSIFFTDLTGNRYAYRVIDVEITEDVSTKALTQKPADLVLFAKNSFSLNHTVVRCVLKHQ